jgi:hypothetical protein
MPRQAENAEDLIGGTLHTSGTYEMDVRQASMHGERNLGLTAGSLCRGRRAPLFPYFSSLPNFTRSYQHALSRGGRLNILFLYAFSSGSRRGRCQSFVAGGSRLPVSRVVQSLATALCWTLAGSSCCCNPWTIFGLCGHGWRRVCTAV